MISIDFLQLCSKTGTFHLVGCPNQLFRIPDIIQLWTIDNTLLFHTGYRLIGTVDKITRCLEELDIGPDRIKDIINTCVTYINYQGVFSGVYNDEIISYQSKLKEAIQNSINKIPIPNTYNSQVITTQIKIETKKPTIKEISRKNHPVTKTNDSTNDQISTNKSIEYNDDDFDDITKELDVFDFVKYKNEYELFAMFYKGLELQIRAANFITYKYCWLKEEKDRRILENEIYTNKDGSNREAIKNYLDLMSNLTDNYQLLWSWYKHYNPSVMWNVTNLYNKWNNHMSHFFNNLYIRYVDEDAERVDLWL